jgi:ABC-2 type transport system permease protein
MYKTISIAIKDMVQSFRNLFAVLFMFIVPILMTGMFYIMFDRTSEDESGFSLPVTKVILVNQDEGKLTSNPASGQVDNSIGKILETTLQSDSFSSFMQIAFEGDIDTAKTAVDNQEAGLALIIPPDTSQLYMEQGGVASLVIYKDPTLTAGPEIVKGIVGKVLDNLSNSKITLAVTLSQLEKSVGIISDDTVQLIIGEYFAANPPGAAYSAGVISPPLVDIQAPEKGSDESSESVGVVPLIMTGMTVFYVFFTGASGAQTILKEERLGTLPRLFISPTPEVQILGGKLLANMATIAVQVIVLLCFGDLVFGIEWGNVFLLVLLMAGIILASAGLGVFLLSWIKTERQAGVMIGGLVTIMGMMGMMPIFVMGIPDPPKFIIVISHLVPQGWAVEGLRMSMSNAAIFEVLPHILILLIWAVCFFGVGLIRFRNRYS